MESVLSKAPGLYDNWHWRSLCQNLVIVKLRAFPTSGNNRVSDSVTEPISSLRLSRSLFLVKLQVFLLNIKVLLQMAMTESVPEFVFGKSLGLTISDNGRVYHGFYGEVFPSLRL